MELVFKKCSVCGKVIWSSKDEKLECCGKEMELIKPNSVEAAVEKHVPEYDRDDEDIIISVKHVMEPNHYIKWILMLSEEGKIDYKELKPGDKPVAIFTYNGSGKLYSYCNIHGLWSKDI